MVEWWLVWTIVGAVVLLSVLLVAVPAMGVRRRVAELNRVKALAQERTTARARKLRASAQQVQVTLGGVQHHAEATRRKVEALKGGRAGGKAG